MLTITESVPEFETFEKYLGFRRETCVFFDIETTGLSPASESVFLIGAVARDRGSWKLTQWLAQDPADEPAVLRAFFEAVKHYDTLIHFNGTTFDLPFLKERADRHALPHGLSEKASLDLYQRFRPLKRPLGLPRMNQTTLEQFLGWPRRDRLTGKQMVSLYRKYAASQEPGLCSLLLLHNHDDLLGMTDLLRLAACSMLFEGIFESAEASVGHDTLTLQVRLKAALPGRIFLAFCPGMLEAADGAQIQPPSSEQFPAASRQCTLDARKADALLGVPGFRGELRHFFPDCKNYYYLPLEDQAIHRSVASFVDREYRTPAVPSNCYIKKDGLFFPQSGEIFSPAFRSSFESKNLYFIWDGPDPPDQKKLFSYTASLLRSFSAVPPA